jgi:predicted NAD/FAD-dependent oxidoreductase
VKKNFSVGIIGAGISGLICARLLQHAGLSVTVLEKSRGVGGRIATRRLDSNVTFDHGAQYFTASDPTFRSQVDQWCRDGFASIWEGRIVVLKNAAVTPLNESRERFVGQPGMNAIAKSLATGVDIQLNVKVEGISRTNGQWQVHDSGGKAFGTFDWLISTAPPPQTNTLFGAHSVPIKTSLAKVQMDPCWAVMLQMPEPIQVPFDAAFVHDSPLSWIARNTSKPDRHSADCWVLHASPAWSCGQVDDSAESVTVALVDEFWKVLGRAPQPIDQVVSHRWLYALPQQPLPTKFLLDENAKLAACGDWCDGPKVEGAFLSGRALAERLLLQL